MFKLVISTTKNIKLVKKNNPKLMAEDAFGSDYFDILSEVHDIQAKVEFRLGIKSISYKRIHKVWLYLNQ